MYYTCGHCREEICVVFKCPICGLGNPNPDPYELLKWLKAHVEGFKLRFDSMGWEIDHGYIQACTVIEAEIKRLIQENKDGFEFYSDRIAGDKGLLDEEVSSCGRESVEE